MVVRDALESDLPAILAIYNDVLLTSTAIYMDEATTLEERRAWWQNRVAAGYPVLVAADASGVTGFASFGDFRSRPGYRFTVEHSVYVRADRRGHGIGRALMRPLLDRATAMGKHVVVAGVDADNGGSLRFHERLGFERVAHFKEVGFKFGRWLDLVFLQRRLDRP
ncbi:MAG: N-acetyltransferase family protein [Vicinamibacterales bacterium]